MLGLARFVLRHKWWVVGFWLVVLIGGVPNLQRATNALSQEFSVPGREGFETNLALYKLYKVDPSVSSIVPVFQLPAGTTVDSPGVKAQIAAAMNRAAAAVPGSHVVSFGTTGNKSFVSADGRTTFGLVWIPFKAKRGFSGATTETDAIRSALQKAPPAGAIVHVTGYDALNDSSSGGQGPGVLIEALIGGLGALIVLAFVFASFIAIVPIVMAIFAIVATFMCMWALTTIASVSFIVQFLVALIGLGVCIDYTLLVVMRWREEHARGADNVGAVERAMATAGEAVVFSGTTVGIGLLALVVLPVPFLRSIGYAGMLIPIVSVLVSITLLPVILATIGPWIDRPRLRTETEGEPVLDPLVERRRQASLVGGGHRDRDPRGARDPGDADPGRQREPRVAGEDRRRAQRSRRADDSGIGSGALTEFLAVVRDPSRANEVAQNLSAVSGSARRRARVAGQRRGRRRRGAGKAGELERRTVAQLAPEGRGAHGAGTTVGGQVAQGADFVSAVYGSFPTMIALIAVLTLILLARAFRSILLPLKAVALNLLSVAAAWGVLVLVWQNGWGSHLIWGIPATGAITAFIPLMVFAFLFGLSMDYEVFILSRVREALRRVRRHRRLRDRRHLAHGPARDERGADPVPRVRRTRLRPRGDHQGLRHRARAPGSSSTRRSSGCCSCPRSSRCSALELVAAEVARADPSREAVRGARGAEPRARLS